MEDKMFTFEGWPRQLVAIIQFAPPAPGVGIGDFVHAVRADLDRIGCLTSGFIKKWGCITTDVTHDEAVWICATGGRVYAEDERPYYQGGGDGLVPVSVAGRKWNDPIFACIGSIHDGATTPLSRSVKRDHLQRLRSFILDAGGIQDVDPERTSHSHKPVPITTPYGDFASIAEACISLGLLRGAVEYRIDHGKPGWSRI